MRSKTASVITVLVFCNVNITRCFATFVDNIFQYLPETFCKEATPKEVFNKIFFIIIKCTLLTICNSDFLQYNICCNYLMTKMSLTRYFEKARLPKDITIWFVSPILNNSLGHNNHRSICHSRIFYLCVLNILPSRLQL